jgi:hypothetical protein
MPLLQEKPERKAAESGAGLATNSVMAERAESDARSEGLSPRSAAGQSAARAAACQILHTPGGPLPVPMGFVVQDAYRAAMGQVCLSLQCPPCMHAQHAYLIRQHCRSGRPVAPIIVTLKKQVDLCKKLFVWLEI